MMSKQKRDFAYCKASFTAHYCPYQNRKTIMETGKVQCTRISGLCIHKRKCNKAKLVDKWQQEFEAFD